MEDEIAEHIRQKDWSKVVEIYTKLLQNPQINKQEFLEYLSNRSESLFNLGNYEASISDCQNIVKTLAHKPENLYGSATRKRLILALSLLQRYQEAELAAREWLILLSELDDNTELKYLLTNLVDHFANSSSKLKLKSLLKSLDELSTSNNRIYNKMNKSESLISCIYCNVSFVDKLELRAHCQTETHEMMIMSDDGHDWYWRPPPRGFKSETYTLCDNWRETGSCRFGTQCVQAHGLEELVEWRERFHYREMRLQRAREKELFGKSYTEELLDKWIQTSNPNALMRDCIDNVMYACSSSLIARVSSKNSEYEWIFSLQSCLPLKAIALLQDTHRNYFSVNNIEINNCAVEIKNNQEWLNSMRFEETNDVFEYKIKVRFKTNIFGTFRQSVVFDFYVEPVLVKHICVDVVPDTDIEKINEIRKEITLSISERWTSSNSEIVHFQSTLVSCSDDWEKSLKAMYPCPQAETFLLSQSTVREKKFTKNNYRERMHELLFVEEMARYDLIAQYNLSTKLQIAHSYILSPNSMAASTAKYSSNGELFASISLGKKLSEDTSEGRLILMHCNTVYISLPDCSGNKRVVYEALIEDKGKNTIYLRLSADTVQQLNVSPDSDVEVQIQFQLNRIPYCEWHYTLDKMPNFKTIFPETYLEPNIPWSPLRQWSRSFDNRLNLKQKEAVVAITTPLAVQLPPILVIGPFGTGKTFTLAQAMKELIKDDSNRILLCTHSNSAADLYIKDYLDAWVEEGNENARPLRIYYQKRWVTTVNTVVQKYCKIQLNGTIRNFQIPSLEDIAKHKIIVVTLSTSVYLSALGLPQGFFTHILLDEAAQAIECETVTPLALANETTRIVLAGDHMQLGPDIFSTFARERNLHISLLERLYDHYPSQFSCKILLCENYRAHESIIQFTSDSFYDQKLVSSSKQPKHTRFYPLTFFTTRGEDVQDKNSTAYYNNSEVYEVVERVAELKRSWPAEWGQLNDQSIGVVTPYSDQVFRIRSELRKKRIDNVCVERVLNVQGKQFRAIILSTVRTRRTCTSNSKNCEVDYGFLSNSKLLNTAITRAQSLVAVVGDPIALCSLGRCSKVWERFIQVCKDNESLFGITWTQLKLQLDGIELKKMYTLNPLAPEFIPRKYKEMASIIKSNSENKPNFNQPVVVPPAAAYPPPPEFSYVPLLYPPPPPRLMYNIPQNIVPIQPPPPIPLNNGLISPHLRMVNHAGIPLTLPPVPHPIQLHKNEPLLPTTNKLIQFMNNVHFPEAQVLSDCVSLLPQHMSLADMLQQPPNLQERWYLYLKETIGVEAAEKFKYLLHTTNQKGSRLSNKSIFERTASTHQLSESPTFNWYDSPSNQINFNKPIYMREQLPGVENIIGLPAQQQPPPPPCNNVHVGGVPNGFKSNPLYGRQVPKPQQDSGGALGKSINNGTSEFDLQKQLQRHVNEEFANLSIGSSNDSEGDQVFKAFINNSSSSNHSSLSINHASSSEGPRFYKYFH